MERTTPGSLSRLLLCLLLLVQLPLQAQNTFPQAGVKDPEPAMLALVNAHIVADASTVHEKGTLLIKNGLILAIGNNISIPAGTVQVDMKGQYIYPAFVEPFSEYGIVAETDKKKNRPAAAGWNEAIQPQVDAARLFRYQEKEAENLRNLGYGAAVCLLRDGIARGSSALVLTADSKENELLLKEQVAANYSFDKGSSTQDYPSSLMGAIALLRQTHLDAQWYSQSSNKNEFNLSLEAWNRLQQLPQVFEVNNKLSALRAARLAAEYGKTLLIKGKGDEYQLSAEMKKTGASFIIPLLLPAPYNIQDAADAERISTADLRHWQMAASNAAILARESVPFCFTAQGIPSFHKLLQYARKIIDRGLDEKEALKALTSHPAALLKIDRYVGSLANGKLANFIVCEKALFQPDNQLLETWVKGKKYPARNQHELFAEGLYKAFSAGGQQMSIRYRDHNITLYGKDTCKGEIKSYAGKRTFSANCLCGQKLKNLQGWLSGPDSFAVLFDNSNWKASLLTPSPKTKDIKPVNAKTIELRYPFVDYGYTQTPSAENRIFRKATVWTSEAEGILAETDVAISNGKIVAIGKNLEAAKVFAKAPYQETDASGKHLTAGIIDEHSHIAIEGGVNECTQSVTSEVRVGDVIENDDINIFRQLSGGVTTAHLLHGSCNPIGGQTTLIKLRWGLAPEQMKLQGADPFIKFALGENVKRGNSYHEQSKRFPQTRMGVEQVMLDAFTRARIYGLQKEEAKKSKTPFRMDLELEALLQILDKKRFITCHSYVQSEVNMMMHVADSFGFRVNTFTHILEGYKVADKIKAHGAYASTFADWWAYKYEVIDAIPQNACLLSNAGVLTAINSDDAEMGRRLNQEAAKSMKYCGMSPEQAWNMVTLNPARMLHIEQRCGSIKVGKDADLVLWSDYPLSIYARVLNTYVDGICYYDRLAAEAESQRLLAEREYLLNLMLQEKENSAEKAPLPVYPHGVHHCDD